MMAFMKSRRGVVTTTLTIASVLFVLTTVRAQGNRDNSNGVPQQIAELQARLAETRAAVEQLQAALEEEKAARSADYDQFQHAIQLIRLPQYLIDNGEGGLPSEIGEVVERQ